jgi:hypothetical protein
MEITAAEGFSSPEVKFSVPGKSVAALHFALAFRLNCIPGIAEKLTIWTDRREVFP